MIEEHKIIEKLRRARNYLDVIYDKSNWWDNCDKLEKAITELERLQQKETPYKPQMSDSGYYVCKCSQRLPFKNYCPQCGQKLDWTDSE